MMVQFFTILRNRRKGRFFIVSFLLLVLLFISGKKIYRTCTGSIYQTSSISYPLLLPNPQLPNYPITQSPNHQSPVTPPSLKLRRAGNPQSSVIHYPLSVIGYPSSITRYAQAPGLQLGMELPYESALSVSGRKLIGATFSTKRYFDPEKDKTLGKKFDFEMKQELQVKIKGQIGEKITVNIDYDDTKTDKRDISVVYKGEPGEAVQEIAFGDLDLSLPQTEFVGYRKQVFGIRGQAQYKNLRFMAIGSQTKGTSESKLFTGNTSLEKKELRDIDYIRRKYYQLAFPGDTIKVGSEKIYFDDRNSANNTVNTSTGMIVEEYGIAISTYVGDFDLLSAGEDYIVDYPKGVIIFRKTIQTNYVIAVDYQKEDGTPLPKTNPQAKAVMIKNENETINTELKNYYNLGRVKIVRDNGKGNFIFNVYDLNRTTVTEVSETGNNVKYPDSVEMDFETGIIKFTSGTPGPFIPDVYLPSPVSHHIIYVEYRYRIKTFNLQRANVVIGSERIVLDGKVLERDKDYFLDYESGWLTFYREEEIKEDSKIEVTYEYAPFAGLATGETLVGARTEYSPLKNFFIGSTVISNFTTKPLRIPDLRTTPGSTLVWEVDTHLTNLKFPLLSLRMTDLSGEYARSIRNSNIFGKALIDSMEGIKLEDSASLNKDYWTVAISSTQILSFNNSLTCSNEDMLISAVKPQLVGTTRKDEKIQVLKINYDLTKSTWAAIIQPLSTIGIDYSKKEFLELELLSDTPGAMLTVEYGSFNEDANNNGRLDTEDTNKDNLLNPDEDIGWEYNNPDGTSARIGADNGRLDSEDLDRDGVLDTFDDPAGKFSFSTDLSAGVWYSTNVPLEITNSTWTAIKQVRLTLSAQTNKLGTIKIAKLGLVGNRWEKGVVLGTGTFTVSAMNNEDNSQYTALYDETKGRKDIYQELYPDWDERWRREQALSMKYNLDAGATATTRSVFPKAQNYSQYGELKFFIYPYQGNQGETFIFQFGTETDFYEYREIINWTGSWKNRTISLDTYSEIMEEMIKEGKTEKEKSMIVNGATIIYKIKGSPKINNIAQIKVGVRNPTGQTLSGELWVNEIYLDKVKEDIGWAYKISADFEVPGWSSFGGKYKEINCKFQPLTPVITGQDIYEQNYYLNFIRIGFLPMNFTFSRKDTFTPPASILENPWLTSLEEDKVSALTGSAGATFSLARWPTIGLSYSKSLTDYLRKQNRLDEKDSYITSADYTNPVRFPLFPTAINLTYRRDDFSLWMSTLSVITVPEKREKFFFNQYQAIKPAYLETKEISDDWSTKLNFRFWSGFTFNPNYSLKIVREEKIQSKLKYPKSLGQTVGFSSNLTIFPWLSPGFGYNISCKEDVNLATLSKTPPEEPTQKRVDRSANGNVTWNFSLRQIFPQFRPTQSLALSTNYRLEYGDSYENIAKEIDFTKKLWIERDPSYKERKSLTLRDTLGLSSRWLPFESIILSPRLSPFNTLVVNANFNGTKEYSNTTGTERTVDTIQWPDLIFSLFKTEKLISLERMMSDSQMNLKISKKVVHTHSISKATTLSDSLDWRFLLLEKYSLYFDYTMSESRDFNLKTDTLTRLTKSESATQQMNFNLEIWRFTLRNEYKLDTEVDSFGKEVRRDKTLSPSLQVYANFNLPAKLLIPLIRKTLYLANQLVFNSTLRLDHRESSYLHGGNTDTYTLTASADYTLSSNTRVTLGLGASRFYNRDDPKMDYYSFEGSMQITIQF